MKRDWFTGADASFPKGVQWHVWFDHWKTQYDLSQPAERFLVDATMKMQQLFVKMAQNLRKNPEWTRVYEETTMRNVVALAEEAKTWYDKNRPREDQIRSYDPRLLILFKALDGAYCVALRLAQELDVLNRKGFILMDMGEERHEINEVPR